jgi:low affinity Fe/Cu permease
MIEGMSTATQPVLRAPSESPPDLFRPRSSRLVHRVGDTTAHAFAGLIAALLAAVWLVVGAANAFTTWWQISLYSCTATVTFVMVFVIQHTQSKQIAAVQRKLDELIRSSHRADNALISVEHAPEDELQLLAETYRDQRLEATGD